MPTVRLAAAETGVNHGADLRLRHLFRPAPNRGVGIQPLAWLTGASAHESKVAYFCIGANTIACRTTATQRSLYFGSWRPNSRCALHRSRLRERSHAAVVSGLPTQLANRIEEPPHRWSTLA